MNHVPPNGLLKPAALAIALCGASCQQGPEKPRLPTASPRAEAKAGPQGQMQSEDASAKRAPDKVDLKPVPFLDALDFEDDGAAASPSATALGERLAASPLFVPMGIEREGHACAAVWAAWPVKMAGSIAMLAREEDVTECYKAEAAKAGKGSSAAVTRARLKVYFWAACEGVDFAVAGVTAWGDVSGAKQACLAQGKSPRILLNATLTVENGDGRRVEASWALRGAGDAKPCRFEADEGALVADACLAAERREESVGGTSTTSILTATYQAASYRPGDKEFTGGRMALELGGWKGDIAFKAAGQAPTWSLRGSAGTYGGRLGESGSTSGGGAGSADPFALGGFAWAH